MSGMAIQYDKAVLDNDQKHARFGGGRTIHGGLRGTVILMASDLI